MPDPTARLNAALEGRYTIVRELGEGGMATVYLAEDLKHQRKVALKVLKPELAAVVGAERFLAEIKVTANLNHPHILPLHDSGEADSFLFYVMPHVEGESLRDRLDREKQLPIDEAVRIATAVANALDHAHRHSVIHRDIKPANILLQDGEPVVADFGIALAVGAASGDRLTETGLSLGTPYYMSPEQATGDQPVGASTDTYALGSVLYEMLVGEPPYPGTTAQAVLGKIIVGKPVSATEQRPSVPAHVDAAVRKALEKLPADRFTTAQDFVRALGDEHFRYGEAVAGVADAGVGPWKWLLMALLATTTVLAIALGWALLSRDAPRPVARYRIALPEDQALRGMFALSPNGSKWVYVGPGERGNQLWLKRRSEHEARPLPGTDGAAYPFFSPDGAWVGFVVGRELRKIPVGGGESITLSDSVRVGVSGLPAAWLDDGSIVLAAMGRSVLRVPDAGGQTERVLAVGDIPERAYGVGVAALPEGRGVLVDVCDPGCGAWGVWTVDLVTGAARSLIPGGRGARYVPTGHVLFGDGSGTLFAVPFDLETLALMGPAVPVLQGVAGVNPAISASDSGDLLYVEGVGGEARQLVWLERDGTAQAIDPSWTDLFQSLALSPDGTRLAVSIGGARGEDLWIKQLDRGPLVRLTTTDGLDRRPAWTPDGLSVTFTSDRADVRNLYVTRADGVGTAEPVLDLGFAVDEGFWSAQGDWLIYRTGVTDGERDIFAWRPGPDSVTVQVAGQPGSDEVSPALSPDGRHLAYVSSQSGRYEVYVRPFPDVESAQFQISLQGGVAPVWAHSGRELFYVSQGHLMVTDIVTSPTFSAGPARALFPTEGYITNNLHARYDVTADDQRFVIVRRGDLTQEGGLILVQNFFEELKVRMGN